MPIAKFQVRTHTSYMGGHLVDNKWSPEVLTNVEMNVVTGGSDENKMFFAATPSGTIILSGLSQAIAEQFPLGKEMYCEFTVVE